MRDNFAKNIKETMAKRVGYRCSNPNCRKLTVGPSDTADKSISIGVAAHITAASSGGKRYDPDLTQDQRKHINNGIWLCASCGTLVDTDEERFPVQILKKWRELSEQAARYDVENMPIEDIGKIVQQISIVSVNQSGGQTAQTIINQAPLRRDLSTVSNQIVAELKKHSSAVYDIRLSSGDGEADALAKQIGDILDCSGWEKGSFVYNLVGSHESGVTIGVPEITEEATVLLQELSKALPGQVKGGKYNDIQKVTIVVGPNPGQYVNS